MYRPSLAHAALVVVVGVADTARADDTVESTTLSLADALRAAEPASESLQAAQSEVERAKAGVDQAKSGYLPRLDGNASYTRAIRTQFDGISFGPPMMEEEEPADDSATLPFGQRNTWRVGFTAVQPIFDGFRTRASVKQARSGVRVAELGVTATRSQLVVQVSAAYFDAALAHRQVEIAEVTLQQSEEILKQTTLNYQQGAAPEFDLVRAQVARDNQSTTLTQFKAQRDVAFVQLARLVGAPLDKPFALTTTLDDDDVDAVVAQARQAAGLPAEGSRLAVQQAKENLAATEAGLDVAKADRMPQLFAQSDLFFIDFANTPFNTDWRTDWNVQLIVSMPIFDGFRRKAVVQANRAAVKTARAQLDQIGEVAQVEIAQANASVAASATTYETTTRTVQQAKRAYEIAELRFNQGASTHLEIVDARVQLEQALLNQARSARDLRVARLRQELLPGLPLGQ